MSSAAVISPAAAVVVSASPIVPSRAPVDLTPLRKLLFFYIALWVLEGALRKWILPTLANPLLVVRDPVLLLIYGLAFAKGVFPKGFFVTWIVALAGLALATSEIATDTPLVVTLYGLRADFLHLPLIFLMPAVFNIADIRNIGRWVLWAAPPMAALVMLQFLSKEGAYVNHGAGGDSGMLESAYGHIRPSGTFSFTNGLSGFTLLVAAFFLLELLEKGIYKRLLWLAAAPSLVVLIVLSGSRAAVGAAALMLATVVFICIVQTRYWKSSIKLIALAGLAIVALGSFAVFQQGLNVFTYRFVKSGGVQSGFIDRFFDAFSVPFTMAKEVDAGGQGLGMGTNVAAGLLVGKRTFLVAEGEFARVIMENGPYVGMAFLGLRFTLMIYLGLVALRSLRQRASTLPALLFSACFNDLIQGQFSQPTALGYATIASGLCLASNVPAPDAAPIVEGPDPRLIARPPGVKAKAPAPAPFIAEIPPPKPVLVIRGRSAYAERMHNRDDDSAS